MLYVSDRISIADREFDISFTRSSGPGGQNVNKVNSKATLRWDAAASAGLPDDVKLRFREKYASRTTKDGSLLITSQRYRDQGRNVADCLSKLRDMILAAAVVPTKRRATQPSRGAKQRRLSEKKAVSERKQTRRRPAGHD